MPDRDRLDELGGIRIHGSLVLAQKHPRHGGRLVRELGIEVIAGGQH